MKVSTDCPYQIIYSLYEHEYLGYLFESFVVQLDDEGRLTLQHQNISAQNASEFSNRLNESDFQLIELMDSMNQNAVIRFFYGKKVNPSEFFKKIYSGENGNPALIKEIDNYLERRRAKILPLMKGKLLFEMGNDGEPTWKKVEVLEDKASVLFHFRKNEDNTHYFPTIKYNDEKVNFQYNGSYIICKQPAWMIANGKLFTFKKEVDGNKLVPFLNKKFIVIPKKVEEVYYKKFITQLVASFDVYAKGFTIKSERFQPIPVLTFSEMAKTSGQTLSLFGDEQNTIDNPNEEENILFDLSFQYDKFSFKADQLCPVSVSVEKTGDTFLFHRIKRNLDKEKGIIAFLRKLGIDLKYSKFTMPKTQAFSWVTLNTHELNKAGITIKQSAKNDKRYFIGESSLNIEIKENIDWFDIYATVKFGDFEVAFSELRKIILKKGNEITLPNGEIAIIPAHWMNQYSEFFAFLNEKKGAKNGLTLKKHHLALVQDMERGELAQVTINRKLEKLKEFEFIEDYPIPCNFKGELRPYQKAGYNWLRFLKNFKFFSNFYLLLLRIE